MPLIDIVQIALVGFIVFSLLIFLISYFGYRAKNKKANTNFRGDSNSKTHKILVNQNQIDSSPQNPPKPPISKSEIVNSVKQKSKKSKFQVFNPKTEKPKIHLPKIIESNISDEVDKKQRRF
ncbi:MAG: hypothetical protein WAU11_09840 [Ignavibacteriaceae bacterium]